MIQTEIGGGARVDPGNGVQRPGFMIRDFSLVSNRGENIRISSFRGRPNLVLVFPGYSDAMRSFLEEAQRYGPKLSEHETVLVAVVTYGPEEPTIAIEKDSPIPVLYDKSHAAYQRSGAIDERGRTVPVVYLTDRFGEIASAHFAPEHSMPLTLTEILRTLEFINFHCPECGPPEWPRQRIQLPSHCNVPGEDIRHRLNID